jgi:hypothetical protein
MLVSKKPYIRVIPGPDPNQYGIVRSVRGLFKKTRKIQHLEILTKIAKPYRPYKENINERRQRIEEKSERILTEDNNLRNDLLKINFFEDSNKKAKLKALRRTVDEIMNQRNFHLVERRNRFASEICAAIATAFNNSWLILNRLKQILYDEERQYEKEIESSIETPLERASRLREKAKKIREEKEREKKQFVEEKLDEKWRLMPRTQRHLLQRLLFCFCGISEMNPMISESSRASSCNPKWESNTCDKWKRTHAKNGNEWSDRTLFWLSHSFFAHWFTIEG